VLPLDQKYFAEYLMASDVLLMNYPDTDHYAKYMSPTKFFAYLATGKPIISSDLPSIRDVVDVESILFTRQNSVKDYCEQILTGVKSISDLRIKAKENIEIVRRFRWRERGVRILKM